MWHIAGDSVVLRAADRHEPGDVPRHPEDPRGLGAGGHPHVRGAVPARGARRRAAREPVALPPALAAAARAQRVRLGRRPGVIASFYLHTYTHITTNSLRGTQRQQSLISMNTCAGRTSSGRVDSGILM